MIKSDQDKNIAYNGHCAFAVSTGKLDVKGGENSVTINDKTYFFSNPIAKLLFKLLPNRIEKADQYWNKR